MPARLHLAGVSFQTNPHGAEHQTPPPTLRTSSRGAASEVQLERPLSAASFQVLESGKVRSHVAALKVGDVLPEMPIFLLPHRFVRLPLEKTYAQAFESLPGRFRGVLAGSH